MPKIVKLTLQMVVLCRAEDVSRVQAMDLDALHQEINDGDAIGGALVTAAIEPLSQKQTRAELLAIGNDGAFFEER